MNGLITILVVLCVVTIGDHDDDDKKPKKAKLADESKKEEKKHHWGYSSAGDLLDPSHWPEASRYCNNKIYMQSPINIETSKLTRDRSKCDPFDQLDVYFVNKNNGKISGLAKNNGHSLVVTPVRYYPEKKGFVKLNKEHNCIMEISNFWNYNHHIPNNQYYCFDSFHFHWGRVNNGKGSEHEINGEQYPLEAHFVHYSCDFNNIGEALSQWRTGGNIGINGKRDVYVLGVIGVFFKIGAPNRTLKKIFAQYDALEKVGSEVLIRELNINHLLPSNKAYYTYDGSLTTPPCFPVVKWHVMKEVLTVSQEQMNNLRELLNDAGQGEGDNYRPIEANPNPVYDCTY
eukprot:285819_1